MAVYLPTFMSPYTAECRDMTQIQIFTATVNGTVITDYEVRIYNNTTNTQLYDSGKIHLTSYLFDGQILSHTIPANTLANGIELKWTLQVWQNTNTITSREVYFVSFSNPTFIMPVPPNINSKSYTFSGNYSHPQNINVKRFQMLLYDANDVLLEDSGDIYNANIQYKFQNNDFVNGSVYKVEGIIEDENGVIISTGKQVFTVYYEQPSLLIRPSAVVDNTTSAISLQWQKAIQTTGVINGTYSYIDSFAKVENRKGLFLDDSSILTFNTDIPQEFTLVYFIQFGDNIDGTICELLDGYVIGYDQTHNRFYFQNDNITDYQNVQVLTHNPYLLIITPTTFVVKEFTVYGFVKSLTIYTIEQLNMNISDLDNL